MPYSVPELHNHGVALTGFSIGKAKKKANFYLKILSTKKSFDFIIKTNIILIF